MPFQVPNINLNADIECVVVDPTGNPNTVIPANEPWAIDVKWSLTGQNSSMIAGEWVVHANLESIGPGPEIQLHDWADPECGTAASGQPLPNATGEYKCHFDVPASAITDAMAGHDSLTMKLVVTVTYKDSLGHWGGLAGYCEGPILQFFKDDI